MKTRLYIEGREADLNSSPNILFTYTETDITNPTVIKNGVSKTVVLPGSRTNREIFGNIWDLERTQAYENSRIGTSFNPSKKAEYVLYVDNEIVESGYLKLNSISRKNGVIEFNLTLYSGIGDFFYNLSYNEEGEKLKLSDLTFMQSAETYDGQTYTYGVSGETEFDMVVRRGTIYTAWGNLKFNPSNTQYIRKWHYINFAPSYNAVPSDNFSADKVLINFSGSSLVANESGYTPMNGFALGTLPEEMDEWGVRDLRSYLQRPVLRVKGLMAGISAYARDKGYELQLSPTFFSSGNPYYEKTWLTMPMFTEMNLIGSDVDASVQEITFSAGTFYIPGADWRSWYCDMIPSEELRVGSERADITFELIVTGNTSIVSDLLTSTYIGSERNFCAYAIQVLACDGEHFNSNIVGASECAWVTSRVGNGDYLRVNETKYATWLNKDVVPYYGKFESQGGGVFKWSTPITLTIDSIPANTRTLAINVQAVANATPYGDSWTYGYRQGRCYTSTAITQTVSTNTAVLRPSGSTVDTATGSITMKNQTAGYSGAKVSKRTLLDTEHTPAEYLISYCKQFGLHFLKNPHNNVIKILTREEFYNNPTPVDIQDLIDYSDMKINPVAFDKKYYDMELNSVGGDFSDKYKKMYSRTFGSQRIDTGYEFDTDTKNILSGNTLKSCVQCTQKSKYYLSPLGDTVKVIPSYRYQGLVYELYSSSTTERDSLEIAVREQPLEFIALGNEKYYDPQDKPQFKDADGKAVKGENCLLFYTGDKQCKNALGNTVYYLLSDDMNIMGVLNNGTPCWVYSESTFSSQGASYNRVSKLPVFSRYFIDANSAITKSLDFGEPKQLFVKDITTTSASTIFNQYWRGYIEDMYDIDDRIVTCKVQLERRPSQELMRRIYWFDNSYWRLNKINNYNITSNAPTECEFIKIKSISAYHGA